MECYRMTFAKDVRRCICRASMLFIENALFHGCKSTTREFITHSDLIMCGSFTKLCRCPICRCEIESHCPRYNQSNFEKLKGPLQPVTVSNHEDPSRMVAAAAPMTTGTANAGTSANSGSSHVRMTIRMPYPTSQLFETTSSTRTPSAADAVSRPPSRYVRPSALRQPSTSRQLPSNSSSLPSPRVHVASALRQPSTSRRHPWWCDK